MAGMPTRVLMDQHEPPIETTHTPASLHGALYEAQITKVGTTSALDLRVRSAQMASSEALNRIFVELRSKNEEIRLKASYDLHSHVSIAARGGSTYSGLRHTKC